MRKILTGLMGFVLVTVGVALAETDYIALPIVRDIQKGVNNANAIEDLRVVDDATIGDALTVAGTLAGAALITSYGYPVLVGGTNGSTSVGYVQYGTAYSFGGTSGTGTFARAYGNGVVPIVVANPLMDATNLPNVQCAGVSNRFTWNAANSGVTVLQWIAISPKP